MCVYALRVCVREQMGSYLLVSSPGRDSRDSRSSHLAEATQKLLDTNGNDSKVTGQRERGGQCRTRCNKVTPGGSYWPYVTVLILIASSTQLETC